MANGEGNIDISIRVRKDTEAAIEAARELERLGQTAQEAGKKTAEANKQAAQSEEELTEALRKRREAEREANGAQIIDASRPAPSTEESRRAFEETQRSNQPSGRSSLATDPAETIAAMENVAGEVDEADAAVNGLLQNTRELTRELKEALSVPGAERTAEQIESINANVAILRENARELREQGGLLSVAGDEKGAEKLFAAASATDVLANRAEAQEAAAALDRLRVSAEDVVTRTREASRELRELLSIPSGQRTPEQIEAIGTAIENVRNSAAELREAGGVLGEAGDSAGAEKLAQMASQAEVAANRAGNAFRLTAQEASVFQQAMAAAGVPTGVFNGALMRTVQTLGAARIAMLAFAGAGIGLLVAGVGKSISAFAGWVSEHERVRAATEKNSDAASRFGEAVKRAASPVTNFFASITANTLDLFSTALDSSEKSINRFNDALGIPNAAQAKREIEDLASSTRKLTTDLEAAAKRMADLDAQAAKRAAMARNVGARENTAINRETELALALIDEAEAAGTITVEEAERKRTEAREQGARKSLDTERKVAREQLDIASATAKEQLKIFTDATVSLEQVSEQIESAKATLPEVSLEETRRRLQERAAFALRAGGDAVLDPSDLKINDAELQRENAKDNSARNETLAQLEEERQKQIEIVASARERLNVQQEAAKAAQFEVEMLDKREKIEASRASAVKQSAATDPKKQIEAERERLRVVEARIRAELEGLRQIEMAEDERARKEYQLRSDLAREQAASAASIGSLSGESPEAKQAREIEEATEQMRLENDLALRLRQIIEATSTEQKKIADEAARAAAEMAKAEWQRGFQNRSGRAIDARSQRHYGLSGELLVDQGMPIGGVPRDRLVDGAPGTGRSALDIFAEETRRKQAERDATQGGSAMGTQAAEKVTALQAELSAQLKAISDAAESTEAVLKQEGPRCVTALGAVGKEAENIGAEIDRAAQAIVGAVRQLAMKIASLETRVLSVREGV